MIFRTAVVTSFLLVALNAANSVADVVEESESRVLKSLKVVVTAVDVSEEAAKVGLNVETVTKEVASVLKSSKIDQAHPEKGMARPVFIAKLYLGTEYKKANDVNDAEVTGDEPPTAEAKDGAAPVKTETSPVKTKKNVKAAKAVKTEDRLAGYLQVRIADLAKIERLGDKPVSVNSFERIYPFQARPRTKVKQAVIDVLLGKTFKRDFRGAVKAARASDVP